MSPLRNAYFKRRQQAIDDANELFVRFKDRYRICLVFENDSRSYDGAVTLAREEDRIILRGTVELKAEQVGRPVLGVALLGPDERVRVNQMRERHTAFNRTYRTEWEFEADELIYERALLAALEMEKAAGGAPER